MADRCLADGQADADLLVPEAIADQRDDLALAHGQRSDAIGRRAGLGRAGRLRQRGGGGSINPVLAAADAVERLHERIRRALGADQAVGAHPNRVVMQIAVGGFGQQQRTDGRGRLTKTRQERERPVSVASHAEDDRIRRVAERPLQRAGIGRRGRHDLEPGVGGDQRFQRCPDDWTVVDY